MEIETTVANGFPVLALVTRIDPPEPDVGIRHPQIEFRLHMGDRKRLPNWIAKKVTEADLDRINDELAAAL